MDAFQSMFFLCQLDLLTQLQKYYADSSFDVSVLANSGMKIHQALVLRCPSLGDLFWYFVYLEIYTTFVILKLSGLVYFERFFVDPSSQVKFPH